MGWGDKDLEKSKQEGEQRTLFPWIMVTPSNFLFLLKSLPQTSEISQNLVIWGTHPANGNYEEMGNY